MIQRNNWLGINNLYNDIAAGLLTGAIMILISISFATLVCGASLKTHLSEFISIFLVSNIALGVVFAFGSSFPNVGVSIQDAPAILAALVTTSLADIPMLPSHYFATVYAAMILICLIGSLFMFFLAYMKLGDLVRFIPYPVLAGFLAGLGWLIFIETWPAMIGEPLTWSTFPHLFEFEMLINWFPQFSVGIALLILERVFSHPLTMPISLLGFIALFFGVYFILDHYGAPIFEWRLFLGPFPEAESIWPWYPWVAISEAKWPLLYQSISDILAVIVLGPLSVLLKTASFEMVSRQESDNNQELITTGVGGIVSPLIGGGAFGYLSLAFSFLHYKLGATHRIVNIVAISVCILAIFLGTDLINNIPSFIAPAILLYAAFGFLVDWLYHSWFSLSKKDYAIIIIIFLTIIQTQLLYGIFLGLIVSLIKFAWEYSRIDPIEGIYDGKTLAGHAIRSYEEAHLLNQYTESICLVRLHGQLFFGNAYNVFKRAGNLLKTEGKRPLKHLIFDFSSIDGVDSSCRSIIYLFLQKAKLQGTKVFTVGLFHGNLPNAHHELKDSGLTDENDYDDVNEALEVCEKELIQEIQGSNYHAYYHLSNLNNQMSLHEVDFESFLNYWEGPKELPEGFELIRKDETEKDIYFLSKGALEVTLQGESRKIIVARIHAGSILGELSYYTEEPRTTSVTCVRPCEVFVLSSNSFKKMEKEDPKIALYFDRYIIKQLAEKIKYNNVILGNLLHR